MRFQDRRVIVTGSAGAIGWGIANAFAKEGGRVLLADPRTDRARALAEENGLERDRYLVHGTDVRSAASIDEAVGLVREAWGGIDVLVNNAGLYPDQLVLEMREEDWDRVLNTNLKGPFLFARAVARLMVEQGIGGQIVNITSGGGAISTRPGGVHYSCSKAGLAMLTRGLALELAPFGIRVNDVAPGLTQTDNQVNPLSPEYIENLGSGIPLGRLCRPEDAGAAVLFVCSDDASFITGASIRVDGGRNAGKFSLPRNAATTAGGG